MLKLIILSFLVRLSESSRILVVFPVPEKKHSILGDSLVKTLLDAGHEVTYVTPFPKDTRLQNLEIIDINFHINNYAAPYWTLPESIGNSSFQMEMIGLNLTQRALQHPAMQELMLNTTRYFDLVIAEWFYTGLLAPLSSLFECSLIWYTPAEVTWKSLSLVHLEVKGFFASPTGLSLTERVRQIWSQYYSATQKYYFFKSHELPAYETSYRNAFQERRQFIPNYETLVYNSSMLLINSHPLLGHTTALPLNAKYIGSHHVGDVAPPLLKNLKKLMDDSKEGVIYVDLETNLVNQNIQEQIMQELIEAFGRIKQTVIWKYDEILVNIPKNLYTMKKPPQRSVLTHENTVAFVNYGDIVSIIEATHCGIPIIGIPILEDQIENMKSVVKRKCGIRLDADNNLSWKTTNAIKTILENNDYRDNARSAKSIILQRLTSPQKEILHLIQMVINTRGASHLRSPTLQTFTFENYNLDILLLLVMILWFITKVVKVLRVHLSTYEDDLEKKDL